MKNPLKLIVRSIYSAVFYSGFISYAIAGCLVGGALGGCLSQRPLWMVAPRVVTWNFAQTKALPSWIIWNRTTVGTDSLITDGAGSSYNSYAAGVPIFYNGTGLGVWPSRTNYLLNSASPATQTTGSLATGTYQFWCIGTGSVTSSSGTGSASGLGALTCSTGSAQAIVVSVAGTFTFTIAGSVNRFQLELGGFPTPFIATGGATFTRTAEYGQFIGYAAPLFQYQNGAFIIEGTGAIAAATRGASNATLLGGGTSAQALFLNGVDKAASFNGTQTVSEGTAKPFTSTQRAGVSWYPGGRAVTAGGLAVVTDTNATGLKGQSTFIGALFNSGAPYPGYITQIAIYPWGVNTAQLSSLTNVGTPF